MKPDSLPVACLSKGPPTQRVIYQPSEIPTHPNPPPILYMVKHSGYDMITLAVRGLTGLSFG